MKNEATSQTMFFGYPQNVFVLSFVSFLNDIGGETIKRTIPIYLANVLQVPTSIIGLVEGVGEATPQLLQPASGYISDRLRKRKLLVVIGQTLRSFMVFLFFVNSWMHVLLIRILDRSGKGIANAPRDALVAASAESKSKGKAFGFNRAMDQAGSVLGLFFAGLITWSLWRGNILLTKEAFQQIVLLTVLPFFLAIFLLNFFITDISFPVKKRPERILPLSKFPSFVAFLVVTFLFTLGSSSDGFLILKAQRSGLPIPVIFFTLAGMSLVASIVNIVAGKLSDRYGRKRLLIGGWIIYATIYILFAFINVPGILVLLFLLYGSYYGFTEGVAKALVADLIPEEWRGTAFGVYNIVIGLTLIPASLIAGFLWQTISPSAAFLFGAIMSLIAVIGLQVVFPKTVVS